jgi:hypothetical protein
MGTCTDIDFCASCKEEFIQGAMHDSGATRAQAGSQFSAMLISLIEGAPFKAKYVKHRALHIAVDGQPACGAKGGSHPLTTNPNESNCKRCLTKIAKQGESESFRSR